MFKNTQLFNIPIPWFGTFEEINLRFYVTRKEGNQIKRGVVFINETIPYPIVAWVANKLYNEHYTVVPTKHEIIIEKSSNYLIHKDILRHQIHNKQGTASTKVKSEVRGGGRKPWRQKGTGRARAGSNRSPLWKGGGVAFGPKKKKYQLKLNKKEWRLSLQTVLFNKKDSIKVVKDLCENFKDLRKTQSFIDCLKKLSFSDSDLNSKILLIVPFKPKGLLMSIQNLPNVNVILANNLNVKSLLDSKSILISIESLKIIEETYGK